MRTNTIRAIALTFVPLCVAAAAAPQGTVDFTNRNPGSWPVAVDAPFFDHQGNRLAGSNYVAQLYAGTMPDPLVALGTPVPFRTGAEAGYFRGGAVYVPFVYPGDPAWVQVRAWDVAGGTTFEEAALSDRWTGVSKILFLPNTGGSSHIPSVPAPLVGLEFPGVPVIVQQPQPQPVREGETATLSVIASSGAPQSYQWYLGSSGDTNGIISGATNATYTTPPLATNTIFWVNVNDAVGSTNSASATLTVYPANAVWLSLGVISGLPGLVLDGRLGTLYRIEYSTNLSATNWSSLVDLSLVSSPFTFIDATATDAPARFYRVVAP